MWSATYNYHFRQAFKGKSNMKQVAVTEEFKPEKGYTKEEIERTKFNSLLTEKGFGRYMLTSRTIEMNDFVALQKKGLVRYWSADYLDDCDRSIISSGWRLDTRTIVELEKMGYSVEIVTIENQNAWAVDKKKLENQLRQAQKKEAIDEKKLAGEILKWSETVLVVDDEDMIIATYQNILKRLAYNVLSAGGGKEAIQVYKENKEKIDMVILDMIMPEMGGRDIYDKLKEINPDVKILLSTVYSRHNQVAEILEHGCDGIILMPFSIRELSQKIREFLDKN